MAVKPGRTSHLKPTRFDWEHERSKLVEKVIITGAGVSPFNCTQLICSAESWLAATIDILNVYQDGRLVRLRRVPDVGTVDMPGTVFTLGIGNDPEA